MTPARRPIVSEVLPKLADELIEGLDSVGRGELASQVPSLEVWGRCSCDDDFCSSFYTAALPTGSWSDEGEHENVVPDASVGMVVLDVVDGVIRYVEVLDRPDVHDVVRAFAALQRPEASR